MGSMDSTYITASDTDILCPYCGNTCEAEWVDIGIDIIQAAPYRCPACNASEIGAFAPDATYSELERQTGWFEPSRDPDHNGYPHAHPARDGECTPIASSPMGKKQQKSWRDIFRPRWLINHFTLGGSTL